MARMLPNYTETQLGAVNSNAERKLYRALRDNLSAKYLVFFQVGWILQRQRDQARDGELDFLICHPEYGILCVEVKGGGISYDAGSGEWHSTDRSQIRHPIKNPVSQVLRAKYSILSKINENPNWRSHSLQNVTRGHSVFFPDISDAKKLSRPDLPASLIGIASSLQEVETWVRGAFAYWENENSKHVSLGNRGLEIIRNTFARSFSVLPLISDQLREQELQRIHLTNEQMRVLDALHSHRRVAVRGGAGTGKTLLAREKACRLARDGFQTLLTCVKLHPKVTHLLH